MAYEAVPETVHEPNRNYLSRVVPGSVRGASAVITPSQFSKNEVAKYLSVNPDKIFVASPSVDRKHFYKRSAAEVKRVKAKYDIFFENYILMVSNIEPRKNYERLVDAYVSLPRSFTDKYPLVIIGGDGWNNQKILGKIQKAKEDNYRIIHPHQYVADEDLPALYTGAKLYLFTPLYEGFGMSPIEAYACGTPALVSNVASVPEAAGQGAVYVDPYSVKDIAAKLKSTIAELDKNPAKFDKAMRQHVDSHASWRRAAEITAAAVTGKPVEHFENNR
jgi:alpha-1,3-rhamnosyl/mannosyltransferase